MLTGHKLFQTLPWYSLAIRAVASPTFVLQHRPLSTSIPLLHSNVAKRSSLVLRQCRGIRVSDGQRCMRAVKADVICTDESQLYCHSHRPQIDDKLALQARAPPPSCRASSVSSPPSPPILLPSKPLQDGWELWINRKLGRRKQAEIRQAMSKPLSERDEAGYIYAYILTHGPRVPTARYAYFKIGRTIDPVRRMYQVSKRCKYVPEIVELFPHMPKLTKQATPQVPKCPVSHRVERLVHLELSGLYPHAGFNCNECGTRHREWFRVARPRRADGTYASDHELWMEHIRPVILRWIQYGVAVTAIR